MELGMPLLILLTLALGLLALVLLLPLNTSAARKNDPVPKNLPPALPLSSILIGLARLSWSSGPSLADINLVLHRIQASCGPITALRLPFCTAVFISDATLAHQVLVDNGPAVSDRLPPSSPFCNDGLDRARITVAPYGETWRHLRRNLVSSLITPSSMKQFAGARRWAKEKLLGRLLAEAATSGGAVTFTNNFSHVSYGLLAAMCFGEKFEDRHVVEIKDAVDSMISTSIKSIFFAFLPPVVQKMLSKNRNGHEEEIFVNSLRARRQLREADASRDLPAACYADSLIEFELPAEEEGCGSRRLREEEMMSLCAEFFGAAGHNTSIAVEWIMSEIVNHRDVQQRLAEELCSINDAAEEEEEEMQRVPYLRAVVMEGLRLHPPSPSYLRHVGKRFEVGGYVVPLGAMVFFNAATMGVDGKVWKDPQEFRPERFLVPGAGGEAKVMGFGVGKRACVGMGLAMLHLSYFVGHLVREFEWSPAEGEKVDMSEKMEFFMRMKTPLRARIALRKYKRNSRSGEFQVRMP